MKQLLSFLVILTAFTAIPLQAREITVASKIFTESYILAEMFAKKVEADFPEIKVERKPGLGGSAITYRALTSGEIDFYPEYTGTITEVHLKQPDLKSVAEIREALKKDGLVISQPLGFNNSYALAVRSEVAKKHKLKTIGDLKRVPDIAGGFSYEFMRRDDGFKALLMFYGLSLPKVKEMEHSLSYAAIENASIDIMDVYTTDAKIDTLELTILEDDLNFFPKYYGVVIASQTFVDRHPEVWASLRSLEGKLSNENMRKLNGIVDIEKRSPKEAARSFIENVTPSKEQSLSRIRYQQVLKKTWEHLYLVTLSLLTAILVGVPLGLVATRYKVIGQAILAITSVIQTIPSLALLCFMIPVFGIGTFPALVALFLYGLLPIVRNTYLGVQSVSHQLKEVSYVLGVSPAQQTRWIELPLAAPAILAGVKTSAVINVGTATLAAFIGAGGYGSFIVTGLALNDITTILHGAVPAAILALVIQWLFESADRILIPEGVRRQSQVAA